MAKEFVYPEIVSLSLDNTEAPMGAMGSGLEPPSSGDWDVVCSYKGHNNGSHSEVHIQASKSGGAPGDTLTMKFVIHNGWVLSDVTQLGTSGFITKDPDGKHFTITRMGHFNQTEEVGFVFWIVAENSPYKGAVGESGTYRPCDVECTHVTYA